MTYTTMKGTVLDLSSLSDEEKAHFERCVAAYRAGASWAVFMNLVRTVENPLLKETGGIVTQAVWDHPLYQAVRDMEDRLGIKQGHLRASETSDATIDPFTDSWVPVSKAAEMKGVTVQGLHGAIRRGDVIARPIKLGQNRLEVSLASLKHWDVNKVRQSARKRPGARL